MLYNLISWKRVACSYESNNLLYEKYDYPHVPGYGFFDTRNKRDLAAFLEKCDITGTRKQINRKLYRDSIKEKTNIRLRIKTVAFVFGEKFAAKYVETYLIRQKLLDKDDYPIWRKPIIKKVPCETFYWKYDNLTRSFECINQYMLMEYAKDCDILVCGRNDSPNNQYCITVNTTPKGIFPIDNHVTPQILGLPSENFIKEHPDWKTVKFDLSEPKAVYLRESLGSRQKVQEKRKDFCLHGKINHLKNNIKTISSTITIPL